MSPQFVKRRTLPLNAASYQRLARLVRQYAERLEANAERSDPRQMKAITDAVNGLRAVSIDYWHRHHGRSPMRERAKEFDDQALADKARGL